MKLIAEIDCGWIKCDICGDARNYLVLRGEDGRYSLERISGCYPHLFLEGLTRDEMLEAIQDNRFIVSTQHALRQLKNVVRRIGREKQVPKPAPRADVSVAPSSAWTDFFLLQQALPGFGGWISALGGAGRTADSLRLSLSEVSQAFTWNDGVTID